MAQSRKDIKGRVLRKGESQRSQDNRYVYTYTDPFGKRKYVYARTLQELRKKEEVLVKGQLDGLNIYVAGRASVNYVFDRYISTKTELRRTTYTNYLYMYDHFVREGFGKKKIAQVKYSDVIQFYQHLLEEENIQVNTLETIHSVLHPTFQLAVRDNIIRTNPSDGVMAEIKKKSKKTCGVRHALTLEQQRAFMNYCRNSRTYWHWVPLFTVMLGTGCRVGEVIGLRWDDIDMEKRLININHSIVYYSRAYKGHRACEFSVSLPKTEAGIREIPMMDAVYDAFVEMMEQQILLGPCKSRIDGMSGFIFSNRYGKIHNPQSINRAIRRIIGDYNAEEVVNAKKEKREPIILPHFSCHHFRHTFCTRFCEQENNVKVIQAVMGHADISTTMNIYAEVTNSKKTEAISRLSENLDVF